MLDCCAWPQAACPLAPELHIHTLPRPGTCTCWQPLALGQQRTCRNVLQLLPREPLVTSGATAAMAPAGLRDKDRGAEGAELSWL